MVLFNYRFLPPSSHSSEAKFPFGKRKRQKQRNRLSNCLIMNLKMINPRGAGICSENLDYLEYGFSENLFFLINSEPWSFCISLLWLLFHCIVSTCVCLHLSLFELEPVFLANKSSFGYLKLSLAEENHLKVLCFP